MFWKFVCYCFTIYFSLNRLFLWYRAYHSFALQRHADHLYINDFCTRMNHIEHLSDYTTQCVEAKRRVTLSIWIESLEFVFNDLFTFHVHWKHVTGGFFILALAHVINQIYISTLMTHNKNTTANALPLTYARIKME